MLPVETCGGGRLRPRLATVPVEVDDRAPAAVRDQIRTGQGFIAALDQSGGSTPKALAQYGVAESEYDGDDEMMTRIHEMRTRIIKSPAFTGDRILGAILFENTMDRQIDGQDSAEYLWNQRRWSRSSRSTRVWPTRPTAPR